MPKLKPLIKFSLATLGLLVVLLLVVPPFLHPRGLTPSAVDGPSIRVYGASVWGFRGYFAIHTWIATRDINEAQYTIHQVIGWRLRRTGTALTRHEGNPDSPWFGNEAILLHEVSGVEAEALIPKVRTAIYSYPFAARYTMFPGPNSNSFTEWVAQEVPELELALPTKAIGTLWMRNYHPRHNIEARTVAD
jgi:hypothetical protein